MRRVACIALPEIRVEVASREGLGAPSPLAIVVARPGGAVKTERDVLGNTRLDVVSIEARRSGVRSGQTVAAARAKCAELKVRVVAEGDVRSALARVAEVALAFGPTTAFDVGQDVVWVEVGGCAHLHGGEGELARALRRRVRALGHACRVAVAAGPRIAAAVARFATKGSSRVRVESGDVDEREVFVVPEGKEAAAMRRLPVAVLAFDDDTSVWLRDLGLRTCGDLQRLPRRALGTRLGARAHDVMSMLDGKDDAPLDAWRPPEVPEERVELEWGAGSLEALAFVLKSLCDRLAARLEGRAMSAARLELILSLDRALCPPGAPPVATFMMVLSSPLARAGDLLAVVRARLEHASVAAPVFVCTLRAPELARSTARTLDMLSPEPKAERALPRLVAEIGAELGPSCIGTLELVDTWIPDRRTRLVAYEHEGGARRRVGIGRESGIGSGSGSGTRRGVTSALVTTALEPSRLVEPVRVARDALVEARHLARFEAAQWWRGSGEAHRRDFFAAWLPSRARERGRERRERDDGALAWVELADRDPEPESCWLRGWID
jgi:protein ImuB